MCGAIWCLACDNGEDEALTSHLHHLHSSPPNGPTTSEQTVVVNQNEISKPNASILMLMHEAATVEEIVLGGACYHNEAAAVEEIVIGGAGYLGDEMTGDSKDVCPSACWLDYRSLTGLGPPSLESDPMFIQCSPPLTVLMQACQSQIDSNDRYVDVWGMLDRGANCDVLVLANAARYAITSKSINGQIGTHVKGMGAPVKQVHEIPALLEDGSMIMFPQFNDSPLSGKTLLNEMGMWYRCHCWVHTPS